MAKYKVTSPTGQKFVVTAPDDATEAQVLAYAQQNWGQTATPPQPKESPTSLKNLAGAAVEPLAAFASGTLAQPLAGLAGLGSLALGRENPAGTVQAVQQALTYAPRTEGGQTALGALNYPFELLGRGTRAAGEKVLDVTGSPTAAALTETALQAAPMLLAKRAPASPVTAQRLAEQARMNRIRDAAASRALEAGYKIPPVQMNPTPMNRLLQGLSGKQAMEQEMTLANDPVTNRLVSEEIGHPKGEPISEGTLRTLKEEQWKAYQELSKLDPGNRLQRLRVTTQKDQPMVAGPTTGLNVQQRISKGKPERTIKSPILDERGNPIVKGTIPAQPEKLTGMKVSQVSEGQPIPGPLQGLKMVVKETRGGNPLEDLKQYRSDAKGYYRKHNNPLTGGDPTDLKKAKIAEAKANMIEQQFEQIAKASGKPEVMNNYYAARKRLAQIDLVEDALNVGGTGIEAPVIGRALDRKVPLTGGLRTVGQFQQGVGSKVTAPASKVTAPSFNKWEPYAAMLAALEGMRDLGPLGSLAGLAPLVPHGARSLAMSPWYQQRYVLPNYQLKTTLPQAYKQAALASLLSGKAVQ